jgi:valyl-tRNA synthetase
MDDRTKAILQKHLDLIKITARLSDITIGGAIPDQIKWATTSQVFVGGRTDLINIEVSLKGIQSNLVTEIQRKEKRRTELAAQMEQDQKKLSNPDFTAKAPPEVLEKTRKRHADCSLEYETLSQEIQRLRKMAEGPV